MYNVPYIYLELYFFSTLKLESKCLAKYSSDGVWYPAVIVDVLAENTFSVMFDHYENMETVSIEDIIPRGKRLTVLGFFFERLICGYNV